MTHTAAILDFAAAPHTLTSAVRADAVRLLADTLAVGAAGANTAEARSVLNTVRSYTEGPTDDCRILGSGLWLAPVSAAFLNGFQIHCLEWDAVHEPAVVHALSVVTAALLAASDRAGGSDPEAFLAALAVGVDIASGLGLAATGPMRFFRPATAGVIGAALAVARLEGCTRDQMADVLGLAYSFAGGTMQAHVEASVALPLQIGRAAQAAMQAVDLVKAGLNGPHHALEGPFGYAALIEPLDLTRYAPGAPWRISEVSIKPFPAGRASHGALGALQDLRHEGQVIAVTLHAPPLIYRLIGRPFLPGAAMSYNRLCLAFLAPLMLRDGIIDPRLETTDAALAAHVQVVLDDNPDPNAMSPQRITITLADGQRIDRTIPANPGSPAQPMTPEQAAAKYALCRELAGNIGDPRLFDDPLSYATDPL
jgi:2-methylcitrate dehydratase PrpD